ncbi:unnamed protein product, partial [Brenthis ino]
MEPAGEVYQTFFSLTENVRFVTSQDESGRCGLTLADRKPNSRMRPRGSHRKLDKRAHPPPSPAPQNLAPRALAARFRPPPPAARSPAKIAADRFVYAVHSVWPPSIHKKARRERRDAGGGAPLRRPAPARRQCGMCQRTERSFRWSVAPTLPVFH